MRIGQPTSLIPPIDEFIVKVAARCNIDCDYCYEFNQGDDTWKSSPKFMTPEIAKLVARRIQEHVAEHGMNEISISLHGGEPLALGPVRLGELIQIFKDNLEAPSLKVRLGLQTNGILLTEQMINLLKRHSIAVGISLDGGQIHNDRHRRSRTGQSTYRRSAAGIIRLQELANEIFSGVLTVIDLANPPLEVLDELYSLGARNVDLLLPHHNWQRPPPRTEALGTEYANWYWQAWSAWISDRWPGLRIRFLENLVSRLIGHPGIYEQMSLSPASLVTITTGGSIEGVDTLKSSGQRSQVMGVHLVDTSFAQVLTRSEYIDRCFPSKSLCPECARCEFRDICVGGYLPHRFSHINGFDNPSVYCQDLKSLIPTIEKNILSRAANAIV